MKYLLLAALLVSTLACNYSGFNCIPPEGEIVSRDLDVESFRGLSTSGSSMVRITQGSPASVKVEGHANHLDLLDAEVDGDILSLGFDGCINNPSITFTIVNPEFTSIRNSGSGQVISENQLSTNDLDLNNSGSGQLILNLAATSIDLRNSGSGRVTLNGTSDAFEVANSGSGSLRANELKTDMTRVSFSGSGRGDLWVNQNLSGSVTGSGSITYRGSAQSSVSVSGSGEVRRSN